MNKAFQKVVAVYKGPGVELAHKHVVQRLYRKYVGNCFVVSVACLPHALRFPFCYFPSIVRTYSYVLMYHHYSVLASRPFASPPSRPFVPSVASLCWFCLFHLFLHRSLRTAVSWCESRDVFDHEATIIRERFNENKNIPLGKDAIIFCRYRGRWLGSPNLSLATYSLPFCRC